MARPSRCGSAARPGGRGSNAREELSCPGIEGGLLLRREVANQEGLAVLDGLEAQGAGWLVAQGRIVVELPEDLAADEPQVVGGVDASWRSVRGAERAS